ncbi:hypothetical protein LIER_15741 [Lithospermum erythrorhizon]|uniref:Uncharacterized protein n=1 Tax=Lithospermum erythrorhizon TaxID=34254 RepID=A0AAV3Q6J1_LITER
MSGREDLLKWAEFGKGCRNPKITYLLRGHVRSRPNERMRGPREDIRIRSGLITPHSGSLVGRIYAQMEEKKIFPKRPKIKAPPHHRDLKKYCEYDKDHGHDTDEFWVLKVEIVKLIRSGGIAGGGDTSNARRRYARGAVYALGSPATTLDKGEISFSNKKLAGLELPHDDPLVNPTEYTTSDRLSFTSQNEVSHIRRSRGNVGGTKREDVNVISCPFLEACRRRIP